MSTGLFHVVQWFTCPVICLSCYVSCVPCIVSGGGGGGEGTVTWGTFPRGCEGTVAGRCFLYKGGGRIVELISGAAPAALMQAVGI